MDISGFVRRHSVFAYFVLTFAISWSGGLLAIGTGGSMRGTTPTSDPRFAYAVVAMLAGPSIAGILMTLLVSGRQGLRDCGSRLLKWRVGIGWYALALLAPAALMTTTLVVLSIASPAFVPGILTSDQRSVILIVGLAVGLSAGVFEELGWTGFAIPALGRRHGVLGTGLIVGVCWSAWHLLPNIWSMRAAAGELPIRVYLAGTALGVFIGYLTAFRVLMVWVYGRTGSLFIGILMHASFTASLLILNPLNISGAHLLIYSFALAGVVWMLAAIFLVLDTTSARPQPERRAA